MVFSTSTRDMEKVCIPKYWFLKWDFRVYICIIKCLFIFDAGKYVHNGLLTHRIESSSTKFEIHTIRIFLVI